ncbi:MAG: hypothetical protein QNJ04_15265 [Desulfobacterales bacterium]|nr:hypothetical protein [Desulfobacterales bacterium]
MLDVAVAYSRYQFLGEEFLTWIWFMIENDQAALQKIDPELAALEVGRRMVLVNRHHRDAGETVTIKGDHAGMEEGLLTLKKGGMVAEIHLVYRSGDHEWQFSLKGESLNISSLKVPATGKVESQEEVEGAIIEKIYLCDKAVGLINRLYGRFIKLRLGNAWRQKVVPAMHRWIASA